MKMQINVDVHHLARIEGHGNIHVRIKNGKLEEARWDVVETPRYFEAILKGKHFTSAGMITARICGICSISHALTALRAAEAAFGAQVPELGRKLRLLAKHGETLQSHALHLFFLAAPDFLGLPSVLPLLETKPEVVALAARLKGLGNRICDAVAGRTTHPVTLRVGGIASRPDNRALLDLRDELLRSLADLGVAEDLVRGFAIPDFSRETEFVSLKGETEYPFIGGALVSTDGVLRPEHEYREMTNEYVDPRNTSKWSRLSRDSYAVGPLARFNNNFELLHPEAKRVAAAFNLAPVCHNPFMASVVRLVEAVHCTYDAVRLIEEIVATPADAPLKAEFTPRAGSGVGAVEAPRGILFQFFEYDSEGRVLKADCVVPSTQNNGNIHRDLPALVRHLIQGGVSDDSDLELKASMLVRSYDPCLSCSVH
jgi:sulfhydrogenase subunit alpha